ncbi:deoxyribonuclease IV [Propionibacterium sp.]|uniref:deoxyribonuclease IV n=1 Tax=Propionibacterium sp. TaxID=1977903 RepID=UPI0039EA1941
MSVTIGSHVDAEDPVAGARARGADIVQIMISDPTSWKKPVISYPGGAAALRDAAEQAGLPMVVHAPYVINVASTNNRIRIPSRKLLQQTVDAAAGIGAIGVVVHGGHVTGNDDPAVGFDNWRKAVQNLDQSVPIFIENTAGGQHAMARTLEALEQLWDSISKAEGFDRVGFCLDTCHAHAAGLGLHGLVGRVKAITGRIDLVHANDSRDDAGSGADRHANLGRGRADPDGIVEVVATGGAPAIVETPGEVQDQAEDIAWLRERL